MKNYFLDFKSCMPRMQFWPGFIGGNFIALMLMGWVIFLGISMVETLDNEGGQGTRVTTISFGSNSDWQKDDYIPDIDITSGMRVEVERTKIRKGEETAYITKTTITEADGTERTSIKHDKFESIQIIAPITKSWGMPVWLQFVVLDICLLLDALILIRLFRNSICRLRDAGFSPWLMLLYLVHGLGPIALLVLFCFPTKKKEIPDYESPEPEAIS